MKGLQLNKQCLTPSTLTPTPTRRPRLIGLVVLSMLMLFAFAVGAYSGNLVPLANASAVTTTHTSASASANTTGYPIKVFFSQYPKSVTTDSSAVFAVNRTSPTIAVATFSLQLLIAGPTLSEQQTGYFTELNTMLSGPSNCTGSRPVGGPDFTLTLNMKGPYPETGTATVKFCRAILSSGIGADARVTAEINATLKQFSNIKKVVILTQDGHCFGDGSGKDLCLK